jgi:hypothetical protein
MGFPFCLSLAPRKNSIAFLSLLLVPSRSVRIFSFWLLSHSLSCLSLFVSAYLSLFNFVCCWWELLYVECCSLSLAPLADFCSSGLQSLFSLLLVCIHFFIVSLSSFLATETLCPSRSLACSTLLSRGSSTLSVGAPIDYSALLPSGLQTNLRSWSLHDVSNGLSCVGPAL